MNVKGFWQISLLSFSVLCLSAYLLSLQAYAGAAANPPGQDASGTTGDRLTGLLRKLGDNVSGFKNLKTDFVQEKELAMFKNKIVLKGRIYLQKPGRLAWHVNEPVRYSVVVDDKSIRQWDEDTNRVQEIALSANPFLKNVLDQLTVWFSGDYGSLLKDNSAEMVQESPLIVEFVPLETNISRKVIKKITITFRKDEKYLSRVKIQETGGDVTTIDFINTVFDAPVCEGDFEVKRRAG